MILNPFIAPVHTRLIKIDNSFVSNIFDKMLLINGDSWSQLSLIFLKGNDNEEEEENSSRENFDINLILNLLLKLNSVKNSSSNRNYFYMEKNIDIIVENYLRKIELLDKRNYYELKQIIQEIKNHTKYNNSESNSNDDVYGENLIKIYKLYEKVNNKELKNISNDNRVINIKNKYNNDSVGNLAISGEKNIQEINQLLISDSNLIIENNFKSKLKKADSFYKIHTGKSITTLNYGNILEVKASNALMAKKLIENNALFHKAILNKAYNEIFQDINSTIILKNTDIKKENNYVRNLLIDIDDYRRNLIENIKELQIINQYYKHNEKNVLAKHQQAENLFKQLLIYGRERSYNSVEEKKSAEDVINNFNNWTNIRNVTERKHQLNLLIDEIQQLKINNEEIAINQLLEIENIKKDINKVNHFSNFNLIQQLNIIKQINEKEKKLIELSFKQDVIKNKILNKKIDNNFIKSQIISIKKQFKEDVLLQEQNRLQFSTENNILIKNAKVNYDNTYTNNNVQDISNYKLINNLQDIDNYNLNSNNTKVIKNYNHSDYRMEKYSSFKYKTERHMPINIGEAVLNKLSTVIKNQAFNFNDVIKRSSNSNIINRINLNNKEFIEESINKNEVTKSNFNFLLDSENIYKKTNIAEDSILYNQLMLNINDYEKTLNNDINELKILKRQNNIDIKQNQLVYIINEIKREVNKLIVNNTKDINSNEILEENIEKTNQIIKSKLNEIRYLNNIGLNNYINSILESIENNNNIEIKNKNIRQYYIDQNTIVNQLEKLQNIIYESTLEENFSNKNLIISKDIVKKIVSKNIQIQKGSYRNKYLKIDNEKITKTGNYKKIYSVDINNSENMVRKIVFKNFQIQKASQKNTYKYENAKMILKNFNIIKENNLQQPLFNAIYDNKKFIVKNIIKRDLIKEIENYLSFRKSNVIYDGDKIVFQNKKVSLVSINKKIIIGNYKSYLSKNLTDSNKNAPTRKHQEGKNIRTNNASVKINNSILNLIQRNSIDNSDLINHLEEYKQTNLNNEHLEKYKLNLYRNLLDYNMNSFLSNNEKRINKYSFYVSELSEINNIFNLNSQNNQRKINLSSYLQKHKVMQDFNLGTLLTANNEFINKNTLSINKKESLVYIYNSINREFNNIYSSIQNDAVNLMKKDIYDKDFLLNQVNYENNIVFNNAIKNINQNILNKKIKAEINLIQNSAAKKYLLVNDWRNELLVNKVLHQENANSFYVPELSEINNIFNLNSQNNQRKIKLSNYLQQHKIMQDFNLGTLLTSKNEFINRNTLNINKKESLIYIYNAINKEFNNSYSSIQNDAVNLIEKNIKNVSNEELLSKHISNTDEMVSNNIIKNISQNVLNKKIKAKLNLIKNSVAKKYLLVNNWRNELLVNKILHEENSNSFYVPELSEINNIFNLNSQNNQRKINLSNYLQKYKTMQHFNLGTLLTTNNKFINKNTLNVNEKLMLLPKNNDFDNSNSNYSSMNRNKYEKINLEKEVKEVQEVNFNYRKNTIVNEQVKNVEKDHTEYNNIITEQQISKIINETVEKIVEKKLSEKKESDISDEERVNNLSKKVIANIERNLNYEKRRRGLI